MGISRYCAAALIPVLTIFQSPSSAAAPSWDEAKVISEATGGQFNSRQGTYFDKTCNETTAYQTEVVDLNGDGQPEVFVSIQGTCWGGMAGVHMNLMIKAPDGQWKPQFGFPGIYQILETKNKGYPDIEIGGPGFCFPVWRWNGQRYDIYKKCPR